MGQLPKFNTDKLRTKIKIKGHGQIFKVEKSVAILDAGLLVQLASV